MPNVPKRISNSGDSDAADVTYTPIDNADWDGNVDPGNVDDALDELANRVTNISAGATDAAVVTYSPSDDTDWDGDVDPGNVDDALDELANRTDTAEGYLNELLPASSPSLDSISTDTVGVSARLSFGVSSSTPAFYTNHPTVDIGELLNITSPNRGIISDSTSLSGTLNDDVVAEGAGSYPADSFGPGDDGTLSLIVNGSTEHSVDLSSFGSGASQNGNGSGFTLSASTPVEFPSGADFTSRQYRTGTWDVNSADMRFGYNTIQTSHATTAGTFFSEEYVYIIDDDSTATVINDLTWTGLSTGGSKSLSGIEYHTSASANLTADIANAYRKTYSDGNAISYPNPNNCTLSSQAYPTPSAFTTSINNISQSASLNATRIITGLTTYDGFRARVRGTRPLLSTITTSYFEGFKLLIDTQSSTGTDLVNDFNDESRRLLSNANFDNDLTSAWDETISLISATSGYADGLQTINSGLYYPTLDFTLATDGPAGNPNYTTASSDRFYYGLFTNGTGSGNFRLTLSGSGVQVIAEATGFSTSAQIKISIKLPLNDVSGTGWLDITKAFVEGDFSDGDGCYAASFGSDKTINSTNWGVSVGTRNTANSFDKIYYRITAPDTFTGNLTEISIEWAVV